MSRLLISPRHLNAIHRHAAMTYPEECCGILIGKHLEGGEEGAQVERVLSAHNARGDRRQDRYLIEPQTILAAHREAQAVELDIVGYYHSHPDHPARPSETDREFAWPGVSYIIVSVEGGEPVATRSWRLNDDRLCFREEAVFDGESSPADLGSAERSRKAS